MATTRRQPRSVESDDPADVVRRVLARWELICILERDARVRGAWEAWLNSLRGRRYVGALFAADDNEKAVSVAIDRERADVASRLGVSVPGLEAAPSIREWLADAHLTTAYGTISGQQLRVQFQLARPWASRKQRGPKNDGEIIRRDVEWFYRVRLKRPAESVSAVAKQYLASTGASYGEKTDGRSIVRDSLKRASILLGVPPGVITKPLLRHSTRKI